MKVLRMKGIAELIDIPNELKDLQREVGGHIETVRLSNPDALMIVNEEGMLLNLCFNQLASLCAEFGIFGTALIVGVDGEEMCDVPEEYLEYLKLNDIFEKENGCTEHCPDTAAQKYSHCYHTTDKEDCQWKRAILM